MDEFPDDSQIVNNKFPYPEGYEWEYKQSYPPVDKLYQTICAMLNRSGGYIVIGIRDNLDIIGIQINQELDKFIRRVDDIFHFKLIMNDKLQAIDKSQICHFVKNINKKNVLAIKITPKNDETYQLRNGTKYDRLGASNIRTTASVFYTETDVNIMINNLKKKHIEETAIIQKEYNTNETKLNGKMNDLRHEIKKNKKDIDKITEILFNKILQEKERAEKNLSHNWFCNLRL